MCLATGVPVEIPNRWISTVLGHGWAGQGYTAASIDPLARGVSWLLSETGVPRRVKASALTATGLLGIHSHDLRHAGNLFMADAGANLRELMERMGHSSSRAALIYLHSTSDRQRTLADAVADRARVELDAPSCGTRVARTGTRPG
jgi:Phage integrase family